ncbi:MAG: redox-sensitive transcriptional activator SoxR [Xanthomonadales bacterium]|nr:redox-sensitive transcriptional activator SoxR [Xanthomonadales bacterium]
MLSIGEIARRAGVSVATLHFYERKGLLYAHRSSGNQRRYERHNLRRIAFIRAAQQVGFSLAEIAAALDRLPSQRTPTRQDWSELSRQWRAELERRMRALQQLHSQLDQCIGCGCLSLSNCGLFNPDDQLGEHGAGPRRWLESDSGANAAD